MAAITPQFPLPLPPWAKWGLRALPLVWAVAQDLLDHPGQVQTNGDLIWRRVVISWERGVAGVGAEDNAVCTFDLANITNSDIDGSWTDADYAVAHDRLVEFLLTPLAGFQSASYRCSRMDFYRMQFASPMTPTRRFVPSGAPEKTYTLNIPGTSVSEALPAQVAMAVTEKTSVPRHWGRVYLPGFVETENVDPLGRWNAGIVDGTVNMMANTYASLAAVELFPVVVSTQVDSILAGSLLGVTQVRADDVPDIIRRRRLQQVTHQLTLPAA